MSEVLHKAKEGWFCPSIEDTCAECGKAFKRTDAHIYKRHIGASEKHYCSYNCYRVYARAKEAEKPKEIWTEEPAELSEIEKAEKRVEECRNKLEEYDKRQRRARGNYDRSHAKEGVKRWEKNLKDAEAALEQLKDGHA